ncbi:MAG: lysyl oxidase family protein [Myxococcaceae bacterium]
MGTRLAGVLLVALTFACGNPKSPTNHPSSQFEPQILYLPDGGSASFSATFENLRGDERRIDVDVRANEPIAGVDVRIGGSAWRLLKEAGPGTWSKELMAPAGSIVEFRARGSKGGESISVPYLWPDATPVDTSNGVPLPDLVVDASRMASSWFLSQEFIPPNSCTVFEKCVTGTGLRTLLRFDAFIQNVGTTHLVLGSPQGSRDFEYSPCHDHYHMASSTQYLLLDADGSVAAEGHKQSFCWSDTDPVPGMSTPRHFPFSDENCNTNMGLSVGWGDIYHSNLECQFVDVTDVPSGEYDLTVRVNPQRVVLESDYSNNVSSTRVKIP